MQGTVQVRLPVHLGEPGEERLWPIDYELDVNGGPVDWADDWRVRFSDPIPGAEGIADCRPRNDYVRVIREHILAQYIHNNPPRS
jgi:hypothetical protein